MAAAAPPLQSANNGKAAPKAAATAACQAKTGPKDDLVTCEEESDAAIKAGKGNDLVTVTTEGVVSVTGKDSVIAIDGEDGADTLLNLGTVNATAVSAGLGLGKGVKLGPKDGATAIGIAGGKGADRIDNGGTINVGAVAITGEIDAGLPVPIIPRPPKDGSTIAQSSATGIAGGEDNDDLSNSGVINAAATALAQSLTLQLSANGSAEADSTSKAQSEAVGIDGESGDDTATNLGDINAVATSTAHGLSVSVAPSGNSPSSKESWTGGPEAEATAIGIRTGSGDDNIVNRGSVDAIATAVGGSAAVVALADDVASTGAASKSVSNATALAAGDGGDVVDNTGTLSAISTATSVGVELAINSDNDDETASEGGTVAEADATGISGDGGDPAKATSTALRLTPNRLTLTHTTSEVPAGGDDEIRNRGEVTAVATAVSGEGSAGVGIGGTSASDVNATATSNARAIDAGAGDDFIDNAGELTAVSTTVAAGIEATVSVNPDEEDLEDAPDLKPLFEGNEAKAGGGVTATAEATGIGADSGGDATRTEYALDISGAGLSIRASTQVDSASGADEIRNTGAITAVATAVGGSISASVGVNDAANVDTATTAKSRATGIALGGGDDTLRNAGQITAVSTATAVGREAAVSIEDDAKVAAEAGTTAEATAIGISADGGGDDTRREASLVIAPTGLTIRLLDEKSGSSGADRIGNSGAVTAVATAVSGELSAPVSIGGSASGTAKSAATSVAAALEAGSGDDTIVNSGSLVAVATSTASAIQVSVAVKGSGDGGEPPEQPAESGESAKSSANTSVTATATATGINADDDDQETRSQFDLAIDGDGLHTQLVREKRAAGGADTLDNSGNVTAVATALSGSIAVPVGIEGDANADTTSTATATAMGVNAGDGSDRIGNGGTVTAVATATAAGLAVAVSTKGDAEVGAETGTTAEATSTGISGDGSSRSELIEADLDITAAGLRISARQEDIAASGNDQITNTGAVTAVATALSGEGSVAVSLDGAAKADAKTTATSTATGIDAGAGDDVLTNDGALTAVASSVAVPLSVQVATKGDATSDFSLSDSSGVAKATAIGISADGTMESRTREAHLDIDFTALALDTGFERAETGATGDDTITNRSAVTAVATAAMPAVDVAVSTKGYAAALSTAEAEATATGIDAGAGDDVIVNEGALDAIATAGAAAINVGVSTKSNALSADTIWNGGTKAMATATGIDGDGKLGDTRDALDVSLSSAGAHIAYTNEANAATGDDTITNTALVNAVATAASGSANVSVGKSGVSAAVSQSASVADATGINAGAGSDAVTNTGVINATALSAATAAAVTVTKSGVSVAGNAIWDGGVVAESTATGIDADGALISQQEEVRFDFTRQDFEDDAGDSQREFTVTLAGESNTTIASGDDTIANHGGIVATAVAEAPAIAVGVTSASGMAAAISTARADAQALGVIGGDGSDSITNTGVIASTAVADAFAVNAAVTKSGVSISADALSDGGTTALANAVGIDADGEGVSLSSERSIEARHTVNLDDGSQEDVIRLEAREREIAGTGDDTIDNTGAIVANAVAITRPLGVAVTKSGVSVAASTSTSQAAAAGIDAGAGDDVVDNHAVVEAAAVSVAAATSVALSQTGATLAGNTVWDAGVTATADAVGIDGDGAGQDLESVRLIEVTREQVVLERSTDVIAAVGDDRITNTGAVVASAIAEAPALAVAATGTGVAAASATAIADARSVAVDAGDGADTVLNAGALVSTAVANANALNVSVARTGGALASDAIFDGGATAVAESIGIAGDGDGENASSTGAIVVTADGIALTSEDRTTSANGADLLVNDGTIVSTAVAAAPSAAVAVTATGAAAAITTASADARSAAIDAGGGDDDITNRGALVATAVGNADTVSVAVASTGVAASGNSFWDGGVTATSEAVGIDADGTGRDTFIERSLVLEAAGVRVEVSTGETAASGDDEVTNTGDIVATAVSLTPSLNVAVAPTGVAAAIATATAGSRAVGIGGGAGDDDLASSGTVTATATSGALAANVAFTSGGGAVTSDALFSGGTTATAEAIGIDGDGEGTDFTSHAEAEIGASELSISGGRSRTGATGADLIVNDGTVTATSVATAGSLGVAVTPAGLAGAITAATAESRAAALDGGSGSDEIDNSGELTSTAVANADTISVAVTSAGPAVAGTAIWDGGATAGSEAVGIAGDGSGADFGLETSATFDANGRRFEFESATLTAAADDVIANDGGITATAVSVTPSLGVAVAPAGVAAAVSRATAESRAAAIDAGGGDDDVTNTGTLEANATSVAVAGNVSFAGAGVAVAADAIFDGGTTADAEAVGIDADGTGTDIETSASLEADVTGTHIRFSHSRQTASGDDRLTNDGDVAATAVTVAPSIAVSVTPAGLAGAITTATAQARAAAIDTGGGDDDITNTGDLTATSVANADTVSVAVTPGGGALAANALWNGGVTAEAEAVGIDSDGTGRDFALTSSLERRGVIGTFELEMSRTNEGGNDIVRNEGDIDISAVAVTPSIGVAVAPAGVSVAASTATANARAASIDTGPGDDEVYNSGDLTATATSVATAVNVSVAPAGVAVAANDVWDGGVNADARALGIRTDGGAGRTVSLTMTNEGLENFTRIKDYVSFSDVEVEATGNDLVVNDGAIDATATAVAPAATVSVAVFGLSASLSTATASSEALGIDTGGGEDTIDNSGDINAAATSVATAVNVAVTVGGVAGAGDAVWDGGTTAVADATAIDAGADADAIENDAELTSRAVAVAPSVSVPVGIFGVALATSTATADAEAHGILGGGGNDTIDNSGHIDASSLANATAVSIPVNIFGVAAGTNDVWDGGVESHASAVGIAADAGDDAVSNSGLVEASAVAVTPSVTVPFTVGGVALATSTSTATTDVQGIRAGAGDDAIDNQAEVRASADATAVTVGTAIAVFGVAGTADSVWNGGTTAEAFADGIAGEGGADVIGNHAAIDAYAVARANSDQIAATLIGVAGSISTSTATTGAAALDGGAGDDLILNTAAIRAEADARATSVAVDVSGIGAAIAADAFWEGGTSATSTGSGIAGGDGEDVLHNVGRIESVSSADSDSVGIAATLGIVAAATASSNATADSFGISGDAGIDEIVNAGEVIVTASADAGAVGVSALGIGVAFAGSFVDDVTVAEANATGLSGGEGEDLLVATEDSSLDVSATGSTKDTDVAVVATIGFADADASAIARANASGLEGGGGDDVMAIAGEVSVDANASGLARSVGWATLAVGRAAAGSSSEAVARGAGGGDGDDVILQDAILSADATAATVGRTISVGGTGFTTGNVESLATATVAGLAGDAGDDLLTNTNAVIATSTADLTAKSFALQLIGATVVNGDSTATATAAGMEGGDGDDQLVSEGSTVAEADSVARAQGTTLNIVGAALSEVAMESIATAAGMNGGAGDDLLINANTAALDASAAAEVSARSFGLSGIGSASVRGESTATSTSIGMEGGEGADEILNSGTIGSTAESIARAQGTSLLLGGATFSETGVHAVASAWGLRGGADDDVIVNENVLATTARSESSLSGINWTFGGVTGLDALAGAAAGATGIDGGAGMDAILNTGTITVDGRTDLRSSGSSSAIFGAPSALGTLDSTLFVAGIAAGADDDQIVNEGSVTLTARSTLNSDAASWVIGGAAGARAGMESDATGIALDGGAGNDLIINTGAVGIALDFDGLIEASSWTFAGGASDAGSYATSQLAVGLAGGEGDDRLENLGSISASTSSDLEVSGGSTALFGNANGQTAVVSTASAVGFAGGAGANELLNFEIVELDATAQMTAESVAFTFAGGASASAELRADAEAAGMAGGSEADDFYNGGAFTVRATADVTSTGGTRTTFGDTTVEAATTAAAHASGIAAEGGDDVVHNEGAFTVIATANPTATSATNAGGLLQIDGVTLARADADARALGVSLGDGANVLLNEGGLEVVSRAGGDTSASSVVGSVTTSSATSVASSEAIAAQARGVVAGDGSNTISNEGRIEVFAENALEAAADSDGSGLIEGNAGANSSARLDAASAVGIDTGHGANVISNDGELLVSADPVAESTSGGRANGIDIFDPANAVADAESDANETLAIGIRAGDGDNVISNDGVIAVTAAPEAHSLTQATFTGVDLALDSFATSESSAGDASAYGILAGDGANLIRNTGSLTVTSAPRASAIARAFGRGWDGDAEARATAAVDDALAVGIFAGDGGNVIVNEGTLVVRSAPVATATVVAEPGLGEVNEAVNQITQRVCSWEPRIGFLGRFLQLVCRTVIVPIVDTVVNEGETVADATVLTNGAQAYGIWTGSGDDLIINAGRIDVSMTVNGTSSLGIGIRAGAGNDELRFGDGSEVLGHVRLEEGDDTLALWGASAVSGLTDAGAGVDALEMYGAGSFAGALANFETAVKHQAGTFTVQNALPTLDSISVLEGTLELAGSYAMGADSHFMAQINADGNHGRFVVGGDLDLGGTMTVATNDTLFIDGSHYDVIAASDIDGAFSAYDLPETPMLSFAVEQGDSNVDVVVSVESFESFLAADDPMRQSLGSYLDDLTKSATGDLATMLTLLQHSDDAATVSETLATLAPSDRESTVSASLAAIRRSQDVVQERLAAIRSGSTGATHLGGDSPVNLFAGNGWQPGRVGGLWVATLSYSGEQPGGAPGAFETENWHFGGGVDVAVGDRFVFGGSLFAGYGGLTQGRQNDVSELESVLGSVYGSWVSDAGYYAQGVVSGGPADYRASRHLDSAFVSRLVESEHSGDVFATSLEAGRGLDHGFVESEWFGAFNYVALTEQAFEETGAGSLGFAIRQAETQSLISELGLRSTFAFDRPWGTVRSRLSLAWLHEHDVGTDRLRGHLLGAPDTLFTFDHDRADDDGYRLGMGLEILGDEDGFFTVKWSEERIGSYSDSSVLAKFGFRF